MQADAHPEGIIHLDVAATDREGKPFSGLAAKDFTLTDNGVPKKIVSFAASNQPTNENERLTEVVLVLDEVNLSPVQLELVKDESIKFLRQNGGHLGEPTSVYWFTTSGLYATATPTTDGNALAEDVAHHASHRTVWAISRSYDPFVTAESESYARWVRSLRAVYSIAIERRGAPARKLLLWMGFGWLPVHGPESYKDAAFPWLVELSTRIREARMVISEVTARTEPTASDFKDAYKDYLAGVRTPSELEERGFGSYSHFALPVLAIQSGGLVLDELSEISRTIEHCVEDARVFYTMSFDPPYAAQPDEYHDLKVQIEAPGLSARTTTGYYDQPVFYYQPSFAARRVSVHELEQILDTATAQQDGELAKQLAGLELSERLNSNLLSLWKNHLRGKKSIAALVTLADESAFLDPPAAEIPSDPAPGLDMQRQMRAENPHYNVTYCCLVGGSTFLMSPRYLGELTIDPGTGAILRLTMEAELGWIHEPNLNPVQPAKGSAAMIEYGPVEIGGKEYICPHRSVVIMRVRTVTTLNIWGQTFDVYAPYETRLNDIVYTDYHKFGADARMLPGFDVVPDTTASPAVNGQSPTKPPPNH